MNYSLKPIENGFLIDARIQANGEKYRKRKTFYGSKRQANIKGREIVEQLEREAQNNSSAMFFETFAECIRFYTSEKEIKRADMTFINRLDAELGSVAVEELPKAMIRFIAYLSTTKTRKGTPYAAGTKNRYQQWIRAIINYCEEWELLEEKPKLKLKKFEETPRDKHLSADDIERLFSAIDEYRPYLRPITAFALQVPSRVSELTEATLFNCDLRNNLLRIPNGTTKNKNGIDKPIPPNLAKYFRSIPKECPWVFYREENGEYKKLKNFNKAWRFVCDKAGIDDLRFHDLRHYSATELVKLNIPERQIMDVCGWKTAMISQYYHKDSAGSSNAVYSVLSGETIPQEKRKFG